MMAEDNVENDEVPRTERERLIIQATKMIDDLKRQKDECIEELNHLRKKKHALEIRKLNFKVVYTEFKSYLKYVKKIQEEHGTKPKESAKGNICSFSLFFGNIPKKVSYQRFEKIINNRKVKSKDYEWKDDEGYCLLHFENDDQVATAVERLKGLRIENQKINVNLYHSSTDLREIIRYAMFKVESYMSSDLSVYGINNQNYWKKCKRQLDEANQMKQVLEKIRKENETEETRQKEELEYLREVKIKLVNLIFFVDSCTEQLTKRIEETEEMEVLRKEVETRAKREYLEEQARESREAQNNQTAEAKETDNNQSADAIQQSEAVEIEAESQSPGTKEQSPTIGIEMKEEFETTHAEKQLHAKDVLEQSQVTRIQEQPTTTTPRMEKENFQAVEVKEQLHAAEITEQSQECFEGKNQTIIENNPAKKDASQEQAQAGKDDVQIMDAKMEKTPIEKETSPTKDTK